MNWNEVNRRAPAACRAFNSWLLAKSEIRGYAAMIKGGVKLTDLPFEMLFGVVVMFFNEQGILFSSETSIRGQLRIRLHRQRASGQFYAFRQGDQKITIQHHLAWQEAFIKAFDELERVCTNNAEEPEDQAEVPFVAFDFQDIHSTPDGTATQTSAVRDV